LEVNGGNCGVVRWVRISDFLGVIGGVVHCRGFESLPFGGVNGVVHGRVFESLSNEGSMVV
jgi:hypothetical protein